MSKEIQIPSEKLKVYMAGQLESFWRSLAIYPSDEIGAIINDFNLTAARVLTREYYLPEYEALQGKSRILYEIQIGDEIIEVWGITRAPRRTEVTRVGRRAI